MRYDQVMSSVIVYVALQEFKDSNNNVLGGIYTEIKKYINKFSREGNDIGRSQSESFNGRTLEYGR